ncbi:hypothetical protein CUC15_19595 [Oceanobacillus zhaokaii]|uniref:DUF418 domain-containing protein n=1 Tax=Oceanobacillus zhaokaii TaxID=2052660 RepID=A0A345PLW4_9BACI|nr:DUF418 domain-containing protein [Oceanobacillus zhaokaii]AXI10994.1 hypothetical protein CUC15_19595 [Oceanobacillus zhaokaii]
MESKGRIRLLDILRGIAVLGTLGTNIWIFGHLGDLTYITTFNYSGWWETEDLFRMIVLFLVNGKLLGLLTIMFGVGMELKYQQAIRQGKAWPRVYIWTAIFLIIEGFIHYTLVMEYDILMSYGVTAIFVVFIIKRGERFIKRIMIIIGSVHAAVILFLLAVGLLANISVGSFGDVVSLYHGGSWLEQVQYRLSNFLPLRIEAIFIIPMNIFLFLLGVLLMRSGVFSPDEDGKRQRNKLFKLGIFLGLPLNMLIFIPGGAFDLPVRYLFAPLLSLGYISFISIMVEYCKWEWLWRSLENVGKMSLSCYLMQNIISSIIFYGWGLALGGKAGSLTIIMLILIISLLQILFAAIWLRTFRAGPMEFIRQRTVKALISH